MRPRCAHRNPLHSGSSGSRTRSRCRGSALGFQPGCLTIRPASSIVIPGRKLLNWMSDPSAPSIQVPRWIPRSPPRRGTELTTSIRLRPANRRSSKVLATARDCADPRAYLRGLSPEPAALDPFWLAPFAIPLVFPPLNVSFICRVKGYKAGVKNAYFESQGTAHEWLTWRRDLENFAPRLFRN
jgi:hypothetical protein